jgi:peptidoglycan/LPS O-acetylase OafA/YrhL
VPPGVDGRPTRLREFDGLRGALALYVAFFHLSNVFPALVGWLGEFAPLARHPGFAVDVFFVLSGQVMMYVYRGEFAERVTLASYRSFTAARIARLYPVHLALLLLLVLAVVLRGLVVGTPLRAEGRYGWVPALASLLMLQGPWIGYLSWNYPTWSISAEFHAYAVFPFAVRWLGGLRRALCVIAAGTALPAALYLYCWSAGGDPVPTNGLPALLRALPLFAVGMACHGLPAARWAGSARAALALAVGLSATLWFGSGVADVLWSPLLVYLTLHNPHLGRVFRLRSLQFLGELSFSLYMVHAVIEALLLRPGLDAARMLGAERWTQGLAGAGLLTALALALSVIGAWALLRWLERPLRERVRRALAGAPARAVAPGVATAARRSG